MRKIFKIIFTLLLVGGLASEIFAGQQSYHSPFLSKLIRSFAASDYAKGHPSTGRYWWMRYYYVSNQYAKEVSGWDDFWSDSAEARELAVYLFNMYISAGMYGTVPTRLDINYLGVTDPFGRFGRELTPAEALKFYNKNKETVKANLAGMFANHKNLPKYDQKDVKNDLVETAFLQALSRSTLAGDAGYYYAAPRWNPITQLPQSQLTTLNQVWKNTSQETSQKVVLYQQVACDPAAFDSKFASHGSGTHYFYRPASEECDAVSCINGKGVCQAVFNHKLSRDLRVYRLYAKPIKGGTLQTAERKNHFTSPAGKNYPEWTYHAAILVVLYENGNYAQVVMDKFLFNQVVPLEQWLAKFHKENTFFVANPYERLEGAESQIVKPDARVGKNVKKGKRLYQPFPINK